MNVNKQIFSKNVETSSPEKLVLKRFGITSGTGSMPGTTAGLRQNKNQIIGIVVIIYNSDYHDHQQW